MWALLRLPWIARQAQARAELVSQARIDQTTKDSVLCFSVTVASPSETGNCNTVTVCPSHRLVTRTIRPSGNSNAS